MSSPHGPLAGIHHFDDDHHQYAADEIESSHITRTSSPSYDGKNTARSKEAESASQHNTYDSGQEQQRNVIGFMSEWYMKETFRFQSI